MVRSTTAVRPSTPAAVSAAVVNPGGGETGSGGKLADGASQGVELADRGPAVDAVSLVACELSGVAVGHLLEQGVDVSTAGQAARVQQISWCRRVNGQVAVPAGG